MLIGSIANGLCSSGGFCAGSRTVVEHQVSHLSPTLSYHLPPSHHPSFQRINGSSFVFSASMPPLLAVSASEGINILRNTPSVLSSLQDNIHTARAILDKADGISIPSHPASPIIHVTVRPLSPSTLQLPSFSASPPPSRKGLSSQQPDIALADMEAEERLLQDVVDEALAQGVMLTRSKYLRGQEVWEARPSIRLAMTSALTRKETERAVGVVKAALAKVLSKRR